MHLGAMMLYKFGVSVQWSFKANTFIFDACAIKKELVLYSVLSANRLCRHVGCSAGVT